MSTIELEKPTTQEAFLGGVVTWDSLHPDLKKALEEGMRDVAAGRVYSSEEVFRELDEWLEKN